MPISSPCNKVCTMDPATRTCVGCRRTLNEIAGWGGMSDGDRQRVLAELARRPWPAGAQQAPQRERS